jgi:hypothetical protein
MLVSYGLKLRPLASQMVLKYYDTETGDETEATMPMTTAIFLTEETIQKILKYFIRADIPTDIDTNTRYYEFTIEDYHGSGTMEDGSIDGVKCEIRFVSKVYLTEEEEVETLAKTRELSDALDALYREKQPPTEIEMTASRINQARKEKT